jgi:hypothetical protein
MKNVLYFLSLLYKSTHFKWTKIVSIKKEEKWAKSNSGPIKYITVVKKEPFIDLYLTGF